MSIDIVSVAGVNATNGTSRVRLLVKLRKVQIQLAFWKKLSSANVTRVVSHVEVDALVEGERFCTGISIRAEIGDWRFENI